jgi:AcrR family transcriptional regulator
MKPEERKGRIVEAAAACFAERGYHATQVSDIIAKAGIARGTFYLYFKSKHEIFHSILDDFIEELQDQIKTIEIGGELTPAEQMRRNVERVMDLILDRPEIGKILFNEAVGLDRVIDERLKEFYARLLDMIGASIQRGIGFGLVRKVDPRVAACIVLGGFRELLVQSAIFRNAKVGRKAMVDGLIDVLLGGLSGKPVLS